MIDAGVDDILVANEVVGPSRIRALAEAARGGRVTVAVDSAANLDDLSAAAVAAGSVIGVLSPAGDVLRTYPATPRCKLEGIAPATSAGRMLALWLVAQIIPGIQINSFKTALLATVVIALVDITIGPILRFIAFPITFLTLGLFRLVLNAVLLKLASMFTPVGIHFTAAPVMAPDA
jgi:uncharacterized membrane protein YvlD (DUF360 family)